MGGQGKGKTISATKTIIERLEKYPKAKFITNVSIKGIKNKTYFFSNSDELVEILKNIVKPEERERIFNIYRRDTCSISRIVRKNRPNIFNFSFTTKKVKYKYNRNEPNV